MKLKLKSRNHIKREKRCKQTAEVFTPPALVNEMLDKLPEEVWQPEKTFLDPSSGNGNILEEVLRRKLKHGHDPLQALSTIYGVDIMADNIKECRLRLLKLISESGFEITRAMIATVLNNVVLTPIGEKYPKGALNYDFSFPKKTAEHHKCVDRWMRGIREENWLAEV